MKKILIISLCSLFCFGIILEAYTVFGEKSFAQGTSKYEELDKDLMEILSFSYTENGQKPKGKGSKAYFLMTQIEDSGERLNPVILEGKDGRVVFNENRLVNFHTAGIYKFEVYQWVDDRSGKILPPGIGNPLENKYVDYDKSKFEMIIDIVDDSSSPSGLKIQGNKMINSNTKEAVKSISFNNKVGRKITVSEKVSTGTDLLKGGTETELKITIKNTGPLVVRNVYVRKYLQKYTNFIRGDKYFKNKSLTDDVDAIGGYGCIENKEHGTWLIREIQPGKSVNLVYKVKVYTCKPDELMANHDVLYEMISDAAVEKFYINQSRNPGEIVPIEVPELDI